MRLAAIACVLLATSAAHAEGVDFINEGKALLVVGACAEGTAPNIEPSVYEAHCKKVKPAQDNYKEKWVTPARAFFAEHVPANLPKTVVYPFAGGDLSTALVVFPDAEEITTMSLEPAGDPRALTEMTPKQIKAALPTVATELTSLYRASYSVTMNMIGAMRGSKIPTQLIFSLSALSINGYEPVSLRYFTLNDDGSIKYLEQADVDAVGKTVSARNKAFSNVEIRFEKKGSTKIQTYRHIVANLEDNHLKKDPAPLRHLEKKGTVAGMTKAASYLLTFNEFSTMRQYIIDHVPWMVSDTTGLAPKWGEPAGFQYETYGTFNNSNMDAGRNVQAAYNKMFKEQPKRPLPFRFGYPDGGLKAGHLIIMKKA
jgi:hypothetical protein